MMDPIPWCPGMPMPVGSLHSNQNDGPPHIPTWLSLVAAPPYHRTPFLPHVARHVDTIPGASIHCRTSHCCGWNRCVELVSHTCRPFSPFCLLGLRRYALLGRSMGRLTSVLSQGKSIDLSTTTTVFESIVPLDVCCTLTQLTVR